VKEKKMKLTFIELAKQGKVVNASLIPDEVDGILEWAVDHEYDAHTSYIVSLDLSEQAVQVEVFKWVETDELDSEAWSSQEIISGDEAIEMAKSFNLIK
jgi:hypothetical protein